ncbi:tetratricopeptide repeat protein [Gemmatimonadota bacterium]
MTLNDVLLITAGLLLVVLFLIIAGRRRAEAARNERDPYVEGLRHLVDGETDFAYMRLKEAVEADTSNIDAYILLGDILRNKGNGDRALKVHRDVTIRSDLTHPLRRIALKSLALDYIWLKEWEAAEETLLDLDRIWKTSDWPLLRLMDVYEASGSWNDAFTLGKSLQDDDQVSVDRLARCRIEEARYLVTVGEGHKARIVLKEALKYSPAASEAYMLIAETYASEKKTASAVEWWEKLISMVPADAGPALARLEDALYELGEFNQMVNIYQGYLETNPDNPDAALALAHFHERRGEVQEAMDILKRHQEQSTAPERLERALALLCYRSGEPEVALELALKACSDPESVELHTGQREEEKEMDR